MKKGRMANYEHTIQEVLDRLTAWQETAERLYATYGDESQRNISENYKILIEKLESVLES